MVPPDVSARSPLFVLAELDDAGLTPSQMRVVVRVARRWSEANGCYESAPAMAAGCGLNVKTVRACLSALVARGILTATERTGQTTRYDWGSPSAWLPSSPVTLPNERAGSDPTQSDTVPADRVGGVPNERVGTLPNERVPKVSHKGTNEGIPKEPRGKAARFDPLAAELPPCVSPEAWAEWVTYRRELRKPLTASSVSRQLKQLTDWTDAGHDADAIIRRSILNSWAGLFEPDPARASRRGPNAAAEIDPADAYARMRAALRGAPA